MYEPKFTALMNKLWVQEIILTFNATGNSVRVNAPNGIVDSELLVEIQEYKPEIIKYMQDESRGLVCPRCRTSGYVTLFPIHNGQSTRLDCAHCGRFLRFGIWYGKETSQI